MTGHGSKFSRKKEAVIAALLTQRNVEEAARVAGIGTQTLYRWMKERDFDAAYCTARRAALGQSIARLQQGSSAAATTMLKIMIDSGAPASTRLRAADCVLNHAKHGVEIEDIDLRVATLEQAAEMAKLPENF
jgi:transposase-like protein